MLKSAPLKAHRSPIKSKASWETRSYRTYDSDVEEEHLEEPMPYTVESFIQ
jgi:hypothetical protein